MVQGGVEMAAAVAALGWVAAVREMAVLATAAVGRGVRETEAALARLCEGLATGLAGEGYR